jgi:hypothetical protein
MEGDTVTPVNDKDYAVPFKGGLSERSTRLRAAAARRNRPDQTNWINLQRLRWPA